MNKNLCRRMVTTVRPLTKSAMSVSTFAKTTPDLCSRSCLVAVDVLSRPKLHNGETVTVWGDEYRRKMAVHPSLAAKSQSLCMSPRSQKRNSAKRETYPAAAGERSL